ncbi:hypothetical protein HYW75_03735 [Candidatus Pacearchaeota archaeon]|nr:hypothetical protein [Candidatus Pacearchaeota archaeon]
MERTETIGVYDLHIKEIRSLADQGLSGEEIGLRTGLTRETIYGYSYKEHLRFGETKKRRRREKLVERLKKGIPVFQLREELDMKPSYFYIFMKSSGVDIYEYQLLELNNKLRKKFFASVRNTDDLTKKIAGLALSQCLTLDQIGESVKKYREYIRITLLGLGIHYLWQERREENKNLGE